MNQSVDFGINLQLTGAQQVTTGATQAAQGLDKVEAELAAINASGKASADALQAILARLNNVGTAASNAGRGATAAASSVGKLGEASRMTGQQTAQLSAQLQDFFIQIQAGGNPLTALIQQGSQLSAVFGGFGNAFKAVGALITPTVLAISGAAAAVGTLAFSFVSGRNEAAELARTLAITGNAAGLTSQRFTAMAETIAQQTSTSIGSARETLLGLAASGQLSGEAFAKTAEAVQRLAKATGQDSADISKQFLGLVDNVAKGAQELNRRFNFLTADQYAFIKSLEDTGQSSKALAVTMDALNARIGDQTQNLGPLAKAWASVKAEISAFADGLKAPFRESGIQDQIAQIDNSLNELRKAGQQKFVFGPSVEDLQQQKAELQEVERLVRRVADANRDAAATAKAGIAFDQLAEQFKTPGAKLDDLRQKIINVGIEAGLSGDRIGALVQQATTYSQANAQAVAQAQAAVGAQAAIAAAKLSATLEGLQAQAAQGQIRQIDLIGKVAEAQFKAAKAEEDRLRKSISLAASLPNNSAQVVALQGQLAAQAVQTAQIQKKAADDVAIAYRNQAIAIRQAMQALREQGEGEINSQVERQQQQRNALIRAVQDYTESLQEASEVAGVELKTMQASAKEREIALRQLQIELGLRRQLKAINDTPFDSQDDRQAQIDKATAAAKAASEAVVDQVTSEFVQRGAKDIENAVLNAFENGFDGALDSLKRMLKREVYRVTIEPYIQQGAQWVSALINGAAGSGGGVAGQSANYLQQAQMLSSLYGYGKSAYGWASGLLGGGSAAMSTGAYTSMANSQVLAAYGVEGAGAAAGGVTGAGAAAGSSTGLASVSTLTWAALAVWAAMQGSSDFSAGFRRDQSRATNTLLGAAAADTAQLFDDLGISDRIADLISGATLTAKLFGRAAPRIEAQGVMGQFAGGEFTGSAYADILEKGGWFRSDKRYTETAQLSDELGKFLDDAAKAVFDQAADFGKALGLPAESLKTATADIKVALTDDAQANVKALETALSGYGEALVAGYAEAVKPLANYGETTAQTITRVGSALTGVNDVLKAIGIAALQASVQGGAAAVALQELFGGVGGLQQAAAGYLQNYFTESERAALATKALGEALGQVGLKLPTTRDEFKALVSAQDLNTEAGRSAFAALMGVADAFAQIVPAARAAEDILAERSQLEEELLQVQGNQAELLARERAKLDPSNVGLFDQIQAARQAKLDQEAAAKAAADAATAEAASRTSERAQWAAFYSDMEAKASQARDAWSQVWDGITGEIKRLRGIAGGTTAAGNLAEFASTTAAARAGDMEAARRLPELSQAVSADIVANSRTREEQALKLASLAAGLDRTLVMSGRAATGGATLVSLPDEVVAMFARITAAQEKGTNLLDDIASGAAVLAMEAAP